MRTLTVLTWMSFAVLVGGDSFGAPGDPGASAKRALDADETRAPDRTEIPDAPPPKAAPAEPLALGAEAIPFALPGVDARIPRVEDSKDSDERTWSLDDFKTARVLVILFTCNHCPTAQLYEDRIIRLVEDYRPRGVELVAISPNDPRAVRPDELGYSDLGDSLEEMRIRARAKRFPFPYLYDGETQATSLAYGPRATPQAFVFDETRRLRYRGRVDDSETGEAIRRHDLREALDEILAGHAVSVAETRSFGCSVKWSDKRGDAERYLAEEAKRPVRLERADVDRIRTLRKNAPDGDAPGRLRLVNVWATWCRPCVAELPDLVETERRFRHRAFELVTVSIDAPESHADAERVLRRLQVSSPNLHYVGERLDDLAETLDARWSGAVPMSVLIAPGGDIVWRHEGQIDPLVLRRAIVRHLSPWRAPEGVRSPGPRSPGPRSPGARSPGPRSPGARGERTAESARQPAKTDPD